MFFQLISTTTVNFVAKIMQRAYWCVIFHAKHKKLPFLIVLTWFLILGKMQDCGQDGDHCWWRHRPPAAPPPIKYIKKIKSFPLKVKSFRNSGTYQKLRRGVSSTTHLPPPPLTPCTKVGVWICVYVRGLIIEVSVKRDTTVNCVLSSLVKESAFWGTNLLTSTFIARVFYLWRPINDCSF